jgi:hypothetical protein
MYSVIGERAIGPFSPASFGSSLKLLRDWSSVLSLDVMMMMVWGCDVIGWGSSFQSFGLHCSDITSITTIQTVRYSPSQWTAKSECGRLNMLEM